MKIIKIACIKRRFVSLSYNTAQVQIIKVSIGYLVKNLLRKNQQ